MALTTRTVTSALAAAQLQVSKPTRDWEGWCLAFVRTAWAIQPTDIKTAKTAWDLSKSRRTTTSPPAGAPVYWSGGAGHVALSVGGGKIYTNDVRRLGRIDLVPIGDISARWGLHYLGWTLDYCGRGALPGIVTQVSLKAIQGVARAIKNPPPTFGVAAIENALWAEGLLPSKSIDGRFGPLAKACYGAWQRRCGFKGKDADGIPGKASLTKLGQAHGFRVAP